VSLTVLTRLCELCPQELKVFDHLRLLGVNDASILLQYVEQMLNVAKHLVL
jgi:hypothetical protein